MTFGSFIERCFNLKQTRPRNHNTKIRKGIVFTVTEHFGLIFCSRTFSDPGAYVFFTSDTLINGSYFGNLPSLVPLGAEVEFNLKYDFPPKWRKYASFMGYFCESMIIFNASKTSNVNQKDIVVEERLENGLVVASDDTSAKFLINHQVWPASSIDLFFCRKELAPKINHQFRHATQPGRTLDSVSLPMPAFLKSKFPNIEYLVVAVQPLSSDITIYGTIVGGGINEIYLDSYGIRSDTGDCEPLQIVMDKKLFINQIDKKKNPEVNIRHMMAQTLQLECVKNVAQSTYPLRAFTVRQVEKVPAYPAIRLPKDFADHEAITRHHPRQQYRLILHQTARQSSQPHAAIGQQAQDQFYQEVMARKQARQPPAGTGYPFKDSLTPRGMDLSLSSTPKLLRQGKAPYSHLTANRGSFDDDSSFKKHIQEDSFSDFSFTD